MAATYGSVETNKKQIEQQCDEIKPNSIIQSGMIQSGCHTESHRQFLETLITFDGSSQKPSLPKIFNDLKACMPKESRQQCEWVVANAETLCKISKMTKETKEDNVNELQTLSDSACTTTTTVATSTTASLDTTVTEESDATAYQLSTLAILLYTLF